GIFAGIFYVDDHLVPYRGARLATMGYHVLGGRCEPRPFDVPITIAHGPSGAFHPPRSLLTWPGPCKSALDQL
ncbi:MAG: hypothetical protein ACRDSH_22120, partial [Pseudonocardiaceae bacterium]